MEVYEMAFEAAMRVFELSKEFPREETYSLTDQIRRSSRSVCANLGEAWRRRRYQAAFSLSPCLLAPLQPANVPTFKRVNVQPRR
jgi:hypothetical protein